MPISTGLTHPPLPTGSDEPTESHTSRPRREGPGGSEGWGEG